MVRPDHPAYRRQVLDHLGLVAGMFDELGLGDVIDHATHQHPELRDLALGEAVNAMVLNGLGLINQALSLVPRFFQHKPTDRLVSPRMAPEQLNDDALGRAVETLSAYGVTELYSLMAATAAERLGLAPRFGHLDRTSVHVEGRDNSDEEPEAQVVHITRGYSRDHRPDLNHVMLELIVEHQAGIPLLMKPLSGNRRDADDFGEAVRAHLQPLQTP
jgi:transposase